MENFSGGEISQKQEGIKCETVKDDQSSKKTVKHCLVEDLRKLQLTNVVNKANDPWFTVRKLVHVELMTVNVRENDVIIKTRKN